jgi:hypothetical protein
VDGREAGRPHPTGESSHGLGERIDHEERSEPLTRVQILLVSTKAGTVVEILPPWQRAGLERLASA